VHDDPAGMAVRELAFPEMHTRTDLEPELPDGDCCLSCETDGPRRLAEESEQPVPGGVDLRAAAFLQQAAQDRELADQEHLPALVS
jgi:hypothetical protein